jgi:hypothetical protein
MYAATIAATQTWRDVFTNPQQPNVNTHAARRSQYSLLWSYYNNSAFENLSNWASYRQTFGLYRYIRSIYNPTQRLVDFYVDHVYPGVLSEDGSRLPSGVALAIPLADDTDDDLKAAIAQLWQWSNWQDGCGLMVRYGAALGTVLVEVADEVDRSKVTTNVVWPGHVAELDLDSTDNVQGYALEYDAVEEESDRTYTYRKEVDKESIRTFKDDAPYGYDGNDAVLPNPYGFVPAVWAKHINQGGDFGIPALRGSLGKIDELNSLAAHLNDHIHKLINNPLIIGSSGKIASLFKGRAGQATEIAESDVDGRQSTMLLGGPADVAVHTLSGNVDLDKALPYVKELLSEVEHDFPELSFYQQLREMSQVTGPAAARLTGDVGNRVVKAQAQYDLQSTKLFQMMTAIAGWRLKTGAWQQRTRQQEKFRNYDLTSYAKGDLDFSIMPRPLISQTEAEAIANDKARGEAVNTKADYISENQALRELGYTDEQMKVIQAEKRSVDVIPEVAQ